MGHELGGNLVAGSRLAKLLASGGQGLRKKVMPSDIGDKLEQAIRVEDEKSSSRRRASRESARGSEEKFLPVRLAAEELREHLESLPSMEFSINPDSVWITLADRDLRFSYNAHTRVFVGEEGAHSWYDGEAYADRYEWHTAEACIDAMIRLCAKYVRMARAIGAVEGSS